MQRKDRELIESSGSASGLAADSHVTHSGVTASGHDQLHKPIQSHGEYVINVSANGSVTAGSTALSATQSNPMR